MYTNLIDLISIIIELFLLFVVAVFLFYATQWRDAV